MSKEGGTMKRPPLIRFGLVAATVFIGSVILLSVTLSKVQSSGKFNQPGNILITDQFNNRVIEIDPEGNIVWQFGNGPGDTSANAIVGTNDAERVGNLTLMSGTGIPAGATRNCKKSGCVDNRVLLVDRGGNIVWQYGQFGVTGFGPDQLNTPVQNTYLPTSGNVLITDQGNERIIEVRRRDNAIVWKYGENGVIGKALTSSTIPTPPSCSPTAISSSPTRTTTAPSRSRTLLRARSSRPLPPGAPSAVSPSRAGCPTATPYSPTPTTVASSKSSPTTLRSGSISPTPAQAAIRPRCPRARCGGPTATP